MGIEGSSNSCVGSVSSIEPWATIKDKMTDRNIVFMYKIKNYYIKIIRVMYQRLIINIESLNLNNYMILKL